MANLSGVGAKLKLNDRRLRVLLVFFLVSGTLLFHTSAAVAQTAQKPAVPAPRSEEGGRGGSEISRACKRFSAAQWGAGVAGGAGLACGGANSGYGIRAAQRGRSIADRVHRAPACGWLGRDRRLQWIHHDECARGGGRAAHPGRFAAAHGRCRRTGADRQAPDPGSKTGRDSTRIPTSRYSRLTTPIYPPYRSSANSGRMSANWYSLSAVRKGCRIRSLWA